MPLFLIYLHFYRLRHTVHNISVTIIETHSNVFTAAAQKRCLHSRGAEPGIEPGLAVHQANAQLLDLRRTLIELRHTLLCYVAPFWATLHLNWATPNPFELRRTLFELLHNILRLPQYRPTALTSLCIWKRILLYTTDNKITVTIP
jgi:hypothetical protein